MARRGRGGGRDRRGEVRFPARAVVVAGEGGGGGGGRDGKEAAIFTFPRTGLLGVGAD